MRFLLAVLCFMFIPTLLFSDSADVFHKIEKDLDSIIVKDLNKKKLIFTKGENQRLSPASLTKIMTAMLAIESGKMNNVVTITAEMKKVNLQLQIFKLVKNSI